MAALVTGGAGYIGAHVADLAREHGGVVVVDNLSSGSIDRTRSAEFVALDLANLSARRPLEELMRSASIDVVYHLAGRKSVNSATSDSTRSFELDNVAATKNVLSAMAGANVGSLVFASSAAVYGRHDAPLSEGAQLVPISEYGLSKLQAERLLYKAHKDLGISTIVLRLFNVVGASGMSRIDRDEHGLMPSLLRAVLAEQGFRMLGVDHPTDDGTCVRDFVDVSDVARAFILAGAYASARTVHSVLNIGSGQGTSVRQAVTLFSAASGKEFEVHADIARPEDTATSIANVFAAEAMLGWIPLRSLGASIEDLVRLAGIT